MISILSFIVAFCVILGGGLIGGACLVVVVMWAVFLTNDHIGDGPVIRRIERWVAWSFLAGAVLSSVACVGILLLAVLS